MFHYTNVFSRNILRIDTVLNFLTENYSYVVGDIFIKHIML